MFLSENSRMINKLIDNIDVKLENIHVVKKIK